MSEKPPLQVNEKLPSRQVPEASPSVVAAATR